MRNFFPIKYNLIVRSLFTRFWVLGKGTLCYPSPGIASCKNIYHCYFFLFLFFICCKFFIIGVQKFFSLVVDTWYCTLHSFIYLGEQKWKTSLASQPIWSASYIETLSINLFSLSDPIVIITTIIQFANVTITLSCQSYLPWWNLNFLFLSFVHLITKVIVPSPGERLSQSGQQSIVTCIYEV